ncbi:MAG: ribbon-helix-helix protein, CopG family [Candidatus Gastranaerophilales bacterium]|nr:ribbon-helix-helix protein, CopG family [Candidatus Gastranaerophilales bacterium]
MTNEQKRFTLRLDKQLFETITKIAKDENRAIGRQIEQILRQYVKQN